MLRLASWICRSERGWWDAWLQIGISIFTTKDGNYQGPVWYVILVWDLGAGFDVVSSVKIMITNIYARMIFQAQNWISVCVSWFLVEPSEFYPSRSLPNYPLVGTTSLLISSFKSCNSLLRSIWPAAPAFLDTWFPRMEVLADLTRPGLPAHWNPLTQTDDIFWRMLCTRAIWISDPKYIGSWWYQAQRTRNSRTYVFHRYPIT